MVTGDDRETPDDVPVVVTPSGPRHTFGPVPIVPPSRGLGFRSKGRSAEGADEPPGDAGDQVAAVALEPEPDSPVVDAVPEEYVPRHARTPDAANVRVLHPASPVKARPVADAAEPAPRAAGHGKHRRQHSAISGTVRSTRDRGLRDMQVVVLDEHWQVIATSVTGTDGVFVAEDVPPGTYRVMATDELDGDFGAGWHDSSAHARAGFIEVKEGRTRRNIDITLASAAAVDLDVEVRRKKAIVGIRVTERATGVRANGSVRVTTKQFGVELPLAKGRTAITLLGSADGSPRLSKKVRVDYLGTKHVQPGSASATLR
ncbi:carboxypeptidase-like regulatory domain-containing protein [Aeromicrobium ginsengisoli]|uniref:Carboxypeptidase regulatory-like domain-containing protein n=1 Tax=Aeromicrobium ginsengisoli TaxID=363867 RepID=A0A5M4FB67_9ACTN|nr:carboxypeptidase-like regulatory domain-containing protein [Aeromicrobium ginsengisoli]KAA1395581.1 carboxypeptidase regulatory-like domain-containing protein [Aeromicrobium ginsengisoli]